MDLAITLTMMVVFTCAGAAIWGHRRWAEVVIVVLSGCWAVLYAVTGDWTLAALCVVVAVLWARRSQARP